MSHVPPARRRAQRGLLRQAGRGIGIVVAVTAAVVLVGWLLALVVGLLY